MTDIVDTDSLVFADEETHGLANKAISNGAATESIDVGGSYYSIIVQETSDLTETVLRTRSSEVIITDSAGSAATETAERSIVEGEDAAATELVTAFMAASEESAAETADATELVDSGGITRAVAETAAATETVIGHHSLVITDSAAAAETLTLQRSTSITITSSAAAAEDEEGAAVAGVADTAASAETITGVVYPVPAEESATALAVETVTATLEAETEQAESAAVSETVTVTITATQTVTDEADATERTRSSGAEYGNFWMGKNGAVALWDGLPFTCIAQDWDEGPVYGVGEYGLYVMGADKDDGAPVRSRVTYDLMDYGSPQRKRWAGIYVLGSANGAYDVSVISNKGTFRYKTQRTREREAVQHRVTPGRGLDSVKYRIDIQQTKPHSSDAVIAELEQIARRI
jgi:hypothetical protein